MVVVDVVHENAVMLSLLYNLEAIIVKHARNVSWKDVRLPRKGGGDDDDAGDDGDDGIFGIDGTAELWLTEQENWAW